MTTEILATASALSDRDLLVRLDVLAANEREATVELVAHLAALDVRPALYAALGFGSLFAYCTLTLRLSEDAACARIEAARACRRFPLILDRLASGALTLTSVRLLARHLTRENHQAVLDRASGRSRREIEALVAELAPQADVTTSVRRLPAPPLAPAPLSPAVAGPIQAPSPTVATIPLPPPVPRPADRPIVRASAPQRYRVQLTIGEETHEKLRRLQALLRREIPDGDPAAILDRALSLLLERVERTKLGARLASAIRPGTDTTKEKTPPAPSGRRSRHVPRAVRRAVWNRDGGQCAFVSEAGRRCPERTFLELHHIRPYARQGPATVENIGLRCRWHNQYEAELSFGPRATDERKRRADARGVGGSAG